MSWLLVVLAGWVVVAAVLAVAIGAAIRVADRRAARAAAAAAAAAVVPPPPNAVPPPAAPGVPPADGLVAGSILAGEPVRPRTPDLDSAPPPARRVDDARPVIVRQRQAH
jgi:hypothetical protein